MKKDWEEVLKRKFFSLIICFAFVFVGLLYGCSSDKKTQSEPNVQQEETKIGFENIKELVNGLDNHYILKDAKEIDYLYGVTYDENIIENIEFNIEFVKINSPGIYTVPYTITINSEAFYQYLIESGINPNDAASLMGVSIGEELDQQMKKWRESEKTFNVVVNKHVEVVTKEKARDLLLDEISVWSDYNIFYLNKENVKRE